MEQEKIVHKFRWALGGFNRRDVLSYLSKADGEHRARVEQLERELAEAGARRDELEADLLGARRESGSAAAEEARTRASLEESARSLARVRGELTQAESKLAVAKNELARLQAQVRELEPMAKSYEQLKERVAVIDLEAHQRAQRTVDEARAQADGLRQEGRQWAQGLLGQYDRLRAGAAELDRRLAELGALSAALRDGDDAARLLREWSDPEAARDGDPPPEEPVPGETPPERPAGEDEPCGTPCG